MSEKEAIKELKERIALAERDYKDYVPEYAEVLRTAVNALEEIQQYRAIGTVEDFKKSDDVRKKVTEIVNRQLIAGKNNYKTVYGCFCEIVDIVQENY